MSQDGIKKDQEKQRPTLLPFDAIGEVLNVLEFGAEKYAPDNWKYVKDGKERYLDAMFRHVMAHANGESVDDESELYHMAHAVCCGLFILHFMIEEERPTFVPDEPTVKAKSLTVDDLKRLKVELDNAKYDLQFDTSYMPFIHQPMSDKAFASRIDVIGQNGNDGLHYTDDVHEGEETDEFIKTGK